MCAERWMLWCREKRAQGSCNLCQLRERQGLRGHGARTGAASRLQISREKPLPTVGPCLPSFSSSSGGRESALQVGVEVGLGQQPPLPRSQRACSLISGPSVALWPGALWIKQVLLGLPHLLLLCPGASRRPWMNPPSIKTRPWLPSLPERAAPAARADLLEMIFVIPNWGGRAELGCISGPLSSKVHEHF